MLGLTAGNPEILQSLLIHREEGCRGAVLGAHVRERRPVRNRQAGQSIAAELDELVHHALLSQHLGEGEHQVRGRRPRPERSGEPNPDHDRRRQVHWLAEHGCLGLDPTHSPAEHSDAVDHGRMRVGPDQGVGYGDCASLCLSNLDHPA